MAYNVCILLIIFEICFITGLNSIIVDKNNEFYDCVKNIIIEQKHLNKIHTTENNKSTKKNKGISFDNIY